MENSQSTVCDCCGVFWIVNAKTCRLTADQLNAFVTYKFIECSHCVTSAAYTRHYGVGEPALLFKKLLLYLFADNALKITDYRRERMRSHNRTDNIMSIAHTVCPFAHSLVDSVFKGHCACFNSVNLCSEKLHSVNVERLADCVLLAHKYFTLKPHKCGGGCGCNSVLTCTCFGNYPGFAHLFGKQALTETVVYFV